MYYEVSYKNFFYFATRFADTGRYVRLKKQHFYKNKFGVFMFLAYIFHAKLFQYLARIKSKENEAFLLTPMPW
ncbi:MAG: hypothetical protein G01um101466_206 [Parcubacteria group bacterium Gr01-1014_66]|nr:MAG: hypothetical protein G01um101466_206 [Parcubacteria group bacterium Gr01-1014_66]